MEDVRAACSGLLVAVAHARGAGPIRSSSDLQRTLRVPVTVAWQVYRLANASDPLSEIGSVPGSVAVGRVIEAARKRGVPPDRLAPLKSSIESFEMLVKKHAGSRSALSSMISSLGDDPRDTIDLLARRSAFRANSQIWGLQARACLWSTTYFPGDSPDHICAMSLRGPIGVKRLRIDAPYIVSGYIAFEHETSEAQARPLGSEDDPESPDPRLLAPFCTRPLPQVSSTRSGGQYVVTELAPGLLGNDAASTIILADVTRDSPWKRPGEAPIIANTMGVATPFETLVVDTLFHRSMFGPLTPRARVFGRHVLPLGISPNLYTEADTLPMSVHARRLGRGLGCMEAGEIPRYAEMYAHVCAKVGLNPEDFDVYRCVVQYPILHAHVGVWFDLPNEGGW